MTVPCQISMIRMAKQTRLKREEIIARAVEFFGEKGEQLDQKDRNPCCVYFEGGGGYVSVTGAHPRFVWHSLSLGSTPGEAALKPGEAPEARSSPVKPGQAR